MENKSFVYNSGEAEVAEDGLKLTIGLFFDGTLNNRANSELRKKYRNGIDPATQQPIPGRTHVPPITADDSPEEIMSKEKLLENVISHEETEYAKLENKKPSSQDTEYERYLKASFRDNTDKMGVDNSFSNDFTNVARMSMCCRNDYSLYVEGIGTLDNTRDVDDGFQYGSGFTGIRGKVRKGCELLAKKIGTLIAKESSKKVLTDITIDVFGFSRGAAAARNFVYEINRKAAYEATPDKVSQVNVVKTTPSYANDFQSERLQTTYRKIKTDSDGKEVDLAFFVDGKMPKMGHLGYSLLKENIITVEEFKTIKLHLRFLGVYETVSSYEEFGDMGTVERVGWRGLGHAVLGSQYNFGDDVRQLNLNNLGRLNQAVHFTAQDEHRENFDLTRFPVNEYKMTIGVEKSFPGVHCDIGGAYETGTEIVDELEVVNKHPGVGFNSYSSWNAYKELDDFKQKLIDDHWYYDDELTIGKEKYLKNVIQYTKLSGRRFLKKEYSYIPLHFMEDYCKRYLKDDLFKSTIADYKIDHEPSLVSAKNELQKYVLGDEKEWRFKTDAQIKTDIERREALKQMELDLKNGNFTQVEPAVAMSTKVFTLRPIEMQQSARPRASDEIPEQLLEEVVVYGGIQGHYRKLRHNFLHWSANRDWMGMDPNNDRNRVEH